MSTGLPETNCRCCGGRVLSRHAESQAADEGTRTDALAAGGVRRFDPAGWFYHAKEDDNKPPGDMLEIYYNSVGRNAVMLLNVPPDKRGLIHENDAARLRELRATLDETFRKNLAGGKGVRMTTLRPHRQSEDAAGWTHELTDGDVRTATPVDEKFWPSNVWYEVNLGQAAAFDRVLLAEQTRRAESAAFRDSWDSQQWLACAGTTIGAKRLRRSQTTVAKVRLVSDGLGPPRSVRLGCFSRRRRKEQSTRTDGRSQNQPFDKRCRSRPYNALPIAVPGDGRLCR